MSETVRHIRNKGSGNLLLQLFGGSSGGIESTPSCPPLKSSLAAGTNFTFLSTMSKFYSLKVPLDPEDSREFFVSGIDSFTWA